MFISFELYPEFLDNFISLILLMSLTLWYIIAFSKSFCSIANTFNISIHGILFSILFILFFLFRSRTTIASKIFSIHIFILNSFLVYILIRKFRILSFFYNCRIYKLYLYFTGFIRIWEYLIFYCVWPFWLYFCIWFK